MESNERLLRGESKFGCATVLTHRHVLLYYMHLLTVYRDNQTEETELAWYIDL